jgi:hypothetical protein
MSLCFFAGKEFDIRISGALPPTMLHLGKHKRTFKRMMLCGVRARMPTPIDVAGY